MFLRKIMVLVSVCIIVTLSCTTYAEYEECLIGTSAKDFFELINHKIENPESVFYQAICTGYFICGNDSLYGIIGNNCEYYITFLVSNIDEEPIVLSGEALFKRETNVDSAISYDSVKKNAEDVSREIYYYSNEVTRGESAYGYPLCIEQYCSSKYMRYSYVFFDPQQHKHSRVDG